MSRSQETVPDELLQQLLALVDKLRDETDGYLDNPGDQQLWYNRGYANGMVLALQRLGKEHALGSRQPDDAEAIGGQIALPWGKAYRHGETVGSNETHEITGTPAA